MSEHTATGRRNRIIAASVAFVAATSLETGCTATEHTLQPDRPSVSVTSIPSWTPTMVSPWFDGKHQIVQPYDTTANKDTSNGISIAMEPGTKLYAGADGTVERQSRGKLGIQVLRLVVSEPENGTKLVVSIDNISSSLVKPGDKVRSGEQIGVSADTDTDQTRFIVSDATDSTDTIDPRAPLQLRLFSNNKIRSI